MSIFDFPVTDYAKAASRLDVSRRPWLNSISALLRWETVRPRLLSGATLIAFALFLYLLLSFRNQLQPAFTTTEAVLALVLLGLVISRV